MNIIYGNPALDPSFSHNMNIRFQDFNTERQRSIMLMANMSLTQNSIVSNITRDRGNRRPDHPLRKRQRSMVGQSDVDILTTSAQ